MGFLKQFYFRKLCIITTCFWQLIYLPWGIYNSLLNYKLYVCLFFFLILFVFWPLLVLLSASNFLYLSEQVIIFGDTSVFCCVFSRRLRDSYQMAQCYLISTTQGFSAIDMHSYILTWILYFTFISTHASVYLLVQSLILNTFLLVLTAFTFS